MKLDVEPTTNKPTYELICETEAIVNFAVTILVSTKILAPLTLEPSLYIPSPNF